MTRPTVKSVVTQTQLEYIQLRAQGLTTKEIQRRLYLSCPSLVSQGCVRAVRRFEAKTLAQLIYFHGQDNPSEDGPIILSRQKYKLIEYLTKGYKAKTFSKWLNVTPSCVSQYMTEIRERYGLKNIYHCMFAVGSRGYQLNWRKIPMNRSLDSAA